MEDGRIVLIVIIGFTFLWLTYTVLSLVLSLNRRDNSPPATFISSYISHFTGVFFNSCSLYQSSRTRRRRQSSNRQKSQRREKATAAKARPRPPRQRVLERPNSKNSPPYSFNNHSRRTVLYAAASHLCCGFSS
jgi:hypothetical protein